MAGVENKSRTSRLHKSKTSSIYTQSTVTRGRILTEHTVKRQSSQRHSRARIQGITEARMRHNSFPSFHGVDILSPKQSRYSSKIFRTKWSKARYIYIISKRLQKAMDTHIFVVQKAVSDQQTYGPQSHLPYNLSFLRDCLLNQVH